MPDAYEHAPGGATFPIDEMSFTMAEAILAALRRQLAHLAGRVDYALNVRGTADDPWFDDEDLRARHVASVRNAQQIHQGYMDLLEEWMNEAAAQYVPTPEERREQAEEARGDGLREDRAFGH